MLQIKTKIWSVESPFPSPPSPSPLPLKLGFKIQDPDASCFSLPEGSHFLAYLLQQSCGWLKTSLWACHVVTACLGCFELLDTIFL